MTLSVGDKLPEATFFTMTDDGPGELKTSEVFGGKKIALFAVPGAYTPTCHTKHLPGFLAHVDEFKAKGCDAVVCITVNDLFVTKAWAESTGATGKIQVLADSAAEFTNAAGMGFDAAAIGLMTRSQRYAAIVDDGVVNVIFVEDAPSDADVSTAESLLATL